MNSKKNVLFISYDGMTDALGQSQVLPYLIGLSKNDYNIFLISFEKEIQFSKLNKEIFNLCNKSNIKWFPQKYTKRPPILSTIWDLKKMWFVAKKLHKINNFKLIHCRSYIPAIIGSRLKDKYGIKFLFDMRGFWVDERVDGGQWNLDKWIYRKVYNVFKKIECNLFSNSDEVVSLTEEGKKELLRWKLNRNEELKINVIPCCVDLNHFDYKIVNQESKILYEKKYNLKKEDLVICYLGSLSTVYMFDEVLKVVAEIEKKYSKFKFLIFTHEEKSLVEKKIFNSYIINKEYIYIDSLLRNEVPIALSVCDYSIFFCKPTKSRKGTSPTRLAELIACGVKIISNKDIGDSEKQIKANNLGYVFQGFDDIDYSTFISNHNLSKSFLKEPLFETAKKLFSLEDGILKYQGIYHRMI